jgi:hypothetical protein
MCLALLAPIGVALGATAGTTAAATVGTLAVASTAATAYGAYSSAQGARQSAQFQSAMADRNAQTSEQLARDAEARGDTAAAAVTRKYAGVSGAQRASFAARGLDISEGSAASILQDTDYFGQLDTLTTRANAAREAWGFRVQGTSQQASAAAYQAQADGQNPLMSAGVSLLGSASAVAGRWYGRSSPGAGGYKNGTSYYDGYS